MAEESTRQGNGDVMLRHSPNHGTQRLPNDDDDVCIQRQADLRRIIVQIE